jgi:hypothetical protein
VADRRYGFARIKKMFRKTHGVGVHAKGVRIHYSAGQQQRVMPWRIRRVKRYLDGHFVAPVFVILALHPAIDRRDDWGLRSRFVEGRPRLKQF